LSKRRQTPVDAEPTVCSDYYADDDNDDDDLAMVFSWTSVTALSYPGSFVVRRVTKVGLVQFTYDTCTS